MIIEVLRESSRAVSYQPAINGPDQHLRIPAWLENFDAFNASALVHTIPLSRREYTVVDKGSSAKTRLFRTMSLQELVISLSALEVSNPKDSVYSFLSMAKDVVAETVPWPETSPLRRKDVHFDHKVVYPIDYSISIAKFCMEFVQYCISTSA
jgi:hypothetical protein